MQPTITPAAARALFGDDLSQEVFHREGDAVWRITMDGPQASPSSVWSPVAESPDGQCWFVEGDIGDPIEGKGWIGPY